ncbi:MAG: TolC family protein [Spirochaetales bacterium]|jgi:outer membrane protein TolC|nr:TolC family protein [Spirochaetales bacterium]
MAQKKEPCNLKRDFTLIFCITVILIAAPHAAPAQAARTLSLKEVLEEAGKNNPSLLAVRKNSESKKLALALTDGWPMPEAGVMFDDIPQGSRNPKDAVMTEMSLSQEIMNPVKLIAMRGMAQSEAGMAEADFHAQRIKIYAETKNAYYDFLSARKAVEIMEENQNLMRQFNRAAESKYATGSSPLQDVLRSRTELSLMESDILTMKAMSRAAMNRLNYMLGRRADSPLEVEEEFSPSVFDFNGEELQKNSEDSPALKSMAWEVEMARSGLSAARSLPWPDFKVSFSLLRTKNSDTGGAMGGMGSSGMGTTNSWKLGFMVMLPLWFGQYSAKMDAAGAALESAQASLADMRNMAAMDLSMALGEAQSASRRITLYENTIIPQTEQAFSSLIVEYTNGRADFMPVMDSLNTLRGSRLDYYKAKVDYEKSLSALEKISGRPLFPAAAKNTEQGENRE